MKKYLILAVVALVLGSCSPQRYTNKQLCESPPKKFKTKAGKRNFI